MTGPYGAAVRACVADAAFVGWAGLAFFRSGAAFAVAERVDQRVAGGAVVLPPPGDVLAALRLTSPGAVKAVILGQDPYPTPGDAHGLAFSVREGVRPPRSLRNIFKELEADLGLRPPASGSLVPWAQQGVLLLNTSLTVEAGAAGSHRGLGWEALADEVVAHVSAGQTGIVFILWGADAQRKRLRIDETKHLVIATAHPSPLSARRGFLGSRPFSTANAWRAARGLPPIEWRL